MSNLLLSLLGAVAEFERSMIRERQREGIELAKKKGVYKGRKPSLTPVQVTEIRKRVKAGEKKAALAAEYQIVESASKQCSLAVLVTHRVFPYFVSEVASRQAKPSCSLRLHASG